MAKKCRNRENNVIPMKVTELRFVLFILLYRAAANKIVKVSKIYAKDKMLMYGNSILVLIQFR